MSSQVFVAVGAIAAVAIGARQSPVSGGKNVEHDGKNESNILRSSISDLLKPAWFGLTPFPIADARAIDRDRNVMQTDGLAVPDQHSPPVTGLVVRLAKLNGLSIELEEIHLDHWAAKRTSHCAEGMTIARCKPLRTSYTSGSTR